MTLLCFIDDSGKEQDVEDIHQLYELIRTGQFSNKNLVFDDRSGRWIRARDHELFQRIQDIATQTNSTTNTRLRPEERTAGHLVDPADSRQTVFVRGPGFWLLMFSILVYATAITLSISSGRSGQKSLTALVAIPILSPLIMAVFIPTGIVIWGLMGSPYMSIALIKQKTIQNGKVILGIILLFSTFVSAIIAIR